MEKLKHKIFLLKRKCTVLDTERHTLDVRGKMKSDIKNELYSVI